MRPAATDRGLHFALTPIIADMRLVDQTIRARLESDVALINTIAEYIVSAGGKRLRPAVLILTARALGYGGERHVDLATVIEFIHTATLLHDDVVDESDLRRGRSTSNSLFGNAASVLVGDFLYSRSFQMMVEASSARVMRIMADATNRIAEGEVLQLLNIHDPSVNEGRYFEVVNARPLPCSRRVHALAPSSQVRILESRKIAHATVPRSARLFRSSMMCSIIRATARKSERGWETMCAKAR